ncbi:MAG TPA: HlyD family secretion protein [Steroidobacteraceae bacterium]|jgi:membrane fusion protein (multidrug efflux system)|nr:HlyD family secretion protein [Steroidobacteraceae bacterium]
MADAPSSPTPTPGQSAPAAPANGDGNRRIRKVLFIVLSVIALIGIGYGVRWLMYSRYIESTDDAYLRADTVTVSPRVNGYIDQIYVIDNQVVKAGDPLVRIDLRNYKALLSQQDATVEARNADIQAAESQITQQEAAVEQARAQLVGAQANAKFARDESDRYKGLRDQGVETDERYQQAVNERNQTAAAVLGAEAGIKVAERQLVTLRSQMNQTRAQLEAAKAASNTARLNLDDTIIRASIDGRIGDKTAQVGQFVQPGTRLMSVVPVQDVYLVANYKETQVRRMKIGQKATVKVDALGDESVPGVIQSFAPGTGAQFALLPPENATGNFIKIVQRVPVRIKLMPSREIAARLLPGLSVSVDIDTRTDGQ